MIVTSFQLRVAGVICKSDVPAMLQTLAARKTSTWAFGVGQTCDLAFEVEWSTTRQQQHIFVFESSGFSKASRLNAGRFPIYSIGRTSPQEASERCQHGSEVHLANRNWVLLLLGSQAIL